MTSPITPNNDTETHQAATPPLLVLPVDNGALTHAPVWESSKRARNWAATLTGTPGNLHREFWRTSPSRQYLYLLPNTHQSQLDHAITIVDEGELFRAVCSCGELNTQAMSEKAAKGQATRHHNTMTTTVALLGSPVEFGADRVSRSERRYRRRWYGVITGATEDALTLHPCDTPAAAFTLALQLTKQSSPASDALHQKVLDLLNSQVTEPGQRWYATRRHTYQTRGKRSGKIADWSFVLRTDAAASAEGLLPADVLVRTVLP